MDRDMERSEKIISAIKQNGFITEDNATTFIHYKDEDRGIKKIDSFELAVKGKNKSL